MRVVDCLCEYDTLSQTLGLYFVTQALVTERPFQKIVGSSGKSMSLEVRQTYIGILIPLLVCCVTMASYLISPNLRFIIFKIQKNRTGITEL